METIEVPGSFLNALMRLAGRRVSAHIPATVADALASALDDIPIDDIPASHNLAPFEFFAGDRRHLVENFVAIFRMYGGCEVESFVKPPLDLWFKLTWRVEHVKH